MTNASESLYDRLVFRHSTWVLLAFALLLAALSPYAGNFRLDTSSDSLVLENDESLKYYREVVSKYNTSELLLVTYAPKGDLFSDEVLADLSKLREKLIALDQVSSIVSIIDAPLIQSPPVSLSELTGDQRTLLSPGTNRELAKKEFLNSDLYEDLLVSDDLSTTMLALSLAGNPEVERLLDQRNALRELRAETGLSEEQEAQLEQITLEHQTKADAFQAAQSRMIDEVRAIIAQHQEQADLFLGGLPMIVADSVDFINADVRTFGLAALAVIILILVIAFRQLGWVVMPLITVGTTSYLMVCILGLLNWPISVVSSNFLSLLAIITLSLNIHLIVRYRELAKLHPQHDQFQLLSETFRSKFLPCLYTALTTIVAFASLIVSGIRPVIDFGWIMCVGIVVAMITTFFLFPALAIKMKPRAVENNKDPVSRVVLRSAQALHQKRVLVALSFTLFAGVALWGITNLTVENRFIDYFKPETEIYKGMVTIDEELGGTTPLDIIIDAPASFLAGSEPSKIAAAPPLETQQLAPQKLAASPADDNELAALESEADVAKADVTESDVAESDLAESDLAESDLAESEVEESNVAQSDVAEPDASNSSAVVSDSTKAALSVPDAGQAEEAPIGSESSTEEGQFSAADFGDFDDDFDDFDQSDSAAFEDDFDDFDDFSSESSAGSSPSTNLAASSYWFNVDGLAKLKAIQQSLEQIPATGKVMSLATTMSVFDNLRDAQPMDNIDLGFMYNVLSEENKNTLFVPYLSADGNQTHINIRVFETQKGLDRNQLISDIRQMLIEQHGVNDEQINISGMLVLYNNMLNSLFSSQIATLGTVFLVIFLMFMVLFRSLKLAFITIVPNVFSAAVVLGIMGIFSIPLDLMTITIAAISVGIAVDNSIHFVSRFRDEFKRNGDYSASLDSATNNIGQAMFYTTIVITAGFLIMVFSNFVPTMYFGVLTGIAMVTALIANLVMLPVLIAKFKPGAS